MKEVILPTNRPVRLISSRRFFQVLITSVAIILSVVVSNWHISLNKYVKNSGSALDISISPTFQLFIYIIALFWISRKLLKSASIAYGLLTAGIILNFSNRLSYNAVVDYLEISGIWFNLNDIYICVGAAALIYNVYTNYRRKSGAEA